MQLLIEGFIEAAQLIANFDAAVLDAAWRSLWTSVCATAMAAIFGIAIGSLLARKRMIGRSLIVLFFRAGMAIPTVLIGVIGYGLLSRRGVLGPLELLYSPWAIVFGEFCLAVPIIVTWTHGAISQLDPRVPETARVLGAGVLKRWRTYLSESRPKIALAILTAFSRCFTELGIAMMLGGNIKFRTRTLTTATALETARGEFARGMAMGILLFLMAFVVTFLLGRMAMSNESRTLS